MPLPVLPALRRYTPIPVAVTTRIAQPVWLIEVSWSAAATGAFVIGTSTLDGTSTLGVSAFDDSFGGAYDNITALVEQIDVTCGRSNDLEQVNEASATVLLRDPDALFSPENPTSPLAGQLDTRLHPIRISSILDGSIDRQFYGWVRRMSWTPSGRGGTTSLECVDLFYLLGRDSPTIASTGPTTVGAAIAKVLDAIGFIDPSMRVLAAGDAIADFSADGSKTGLQLIQELLEFERGIFWITGAGVAVYETRHSRAQRTSAGTISNEMKAIGPGIDADRIATRVRVTRTGGTTQVAEDTDAAARWGNADGPSIETPYLASDADALALAQYILSQKKSPASPLRSLDFDGRTPALLAQLLGREFNDRVTISEAVGGTSGEFFVEQRKISVRSRSRLVTGSWIVSRAPANAVFVVDQSTLDSPSVVAY